MGNPTEHLSRGWLRPNRGEHDPGKNVKERDGNDHPDDEEPLVFHQDEFSSPTIRFVTDDIEIPKDRRSFFGCLRRLPIRPQGADKQQPTPSDSKPRPSAKIRFLLPDDLETLKARWARPLWIPVTGGGAHRTSARPSSPHTARRDTLIFSRITRSTPACSRRSAVRSASRMGRRVLARTRRFRISRT